MWVAVSGVEEKSNINRNQISYYTPPWLSLYSLLGETMNFIIRTVKNTDRKSQRKKNKKKKKHLYYLWRWMFICDPSCSQTPSMKKEEKYKNPIPSTVSLPNQDDETKGEPIKTHLLIYSISISFRFLSRN